MSNNLHDKYHQSYHPDCKQCREDKKATLARKKELLSKLKK